MLKMCIGLARLTINDQCLQKGTVSVASSKASRNAEEQFLIAAFHALDVGTFDGEWLWLSMCQMLDSYDCDVPVRSSPA